MSNRMSMYVTGASWACGCRANACEKHQDRPPFAAALQSEVSALRTDYSILADDHLELKADYSALRSRLDLAIEALRVIREQGGSCPCGAWFGQERERGHVIGCPVGESVAAEIEEKP